MIHTADQLTWITDNIRYALWYTMVSSLTWYFRSHSNMLIWCSWIISYYYQLKTVVLLKVFEETNFLQDFWRWEIS